MIFMVSSIISCYAIRLLLIRFQKVLMQSSGRICILFNIITSCKLNWHFCLSSIHKFDNGDFTSHFYLCVLWQITCYMIIDLSTEFWRIQHWSSGGFRRKADFHIEIHDIVLASLKRVAGLLSQLEAETESSGCLFCCRKTHTGIY